MGRRAREDFHGAGVRLVPGFKQAAMNTPPQNKSTIPAITVLMSVHNGMPFVKEAVESVLAQTLGDFEFLILDDASTDGTRDYLTSLSDERIRVITLDQNIGLTPALNRGLKEARGIYIARQDADDLSHPDRFRLCAMYLQLNPVCAAVGSQVWLIDRQGRSLGKKQFPLAPNSIRFAHLFDNALAHSAVMFRKAAVLEAGGYDESFPASQDYDLWSRLSARHALANLPQYCATLRILDDSITRQHRRPELIQRVQREHFTRLFSREPAEQELELISLFRSQIPPDNLPLFRLLLDDLVRRFKATPKSAASDFNRTLGLIHARIGYNLLCVSRLDAWKELMAAMLAHPLCVFSLPWTKIAALTLLGDKARQLYTKAAK